MKTLIIGASGFVGSHLIRQLSKDGRSVVATCLPDEQLEAGVTVCPLDILNPAEIETILTAVKPEAVINLAAQSSVALSWEMPAVTVDVNIKGTVNLLEAVKKTDRSIRVLLIGSGDQYGSVPKDRIPIREEEPQQPKSVYAVTKYTQDMLGELYAKAFDMNIVRIRAFNHIGPGQSPKFVVSDFCRQVALCERMDNPCVIKVGNLEISRDFTDVRDVVRAYSLLCEKGKNGESYNIGSGSSITIREILDGLLSYSKKPISVEIDSGKFRPVDIPVIQADISKIVRDVGWRPIIDIHQTLSDTLEYWRNNC